MKLHILKIKESYFYDVANGNKKAELRKNDRDFLVNDLIHFVNPNQKEIDCFESNLYEITHVLKNVPEYGLDKDYCILSIKKIR